MNCQHCGKPVTLPRHISRKQRAILDYLAACIEADGFAPSFEEIAERFGYRSLATVHEHVENLQRKGWITREFNEKRSIVIVAEVA